MSQFKAKSRQTIVEISRSIELMGSIFIVPGEMKNLERVAHVLEREGYTVQFYADTQSLLLGAIAKPPELMILNTAVTEIEDYQLCCEIKSHTNTQHIPLVFIAASDDLFHKNKALELGVNDYITQPCTFLEILVRVKNQLRIQALYHQIHEQERLVQNEKWHRKLAEERYKLAEEKFGKAFYSSPNPSTITLLGNGRHIEVNDSFCKVTGYTADEIIGKNAVELDLWVDPIARKKLFDRIHQERRVKNHEFEFRTKNGTVHTAILSCEIIWINGEECLLSLSNDITERKQAESQLQIANNALKRLADLDGLTQIANRRRFDSYLKYHLKEAVQQQTYLSLVLCDVDHFKAYNDHYGHLEGDNCLVQLAQLFQQSLPAPKDFVARYGGEEFAIILPGRSPTEARETLEQVRRAIHAAQIPHAKAIWTEHVTVSFGGYTMRPKALSMTPKDMIKKADDALYCAKQAGRDQIIFTE